MSDLNYQFLKQIERLPFVDAIFLYGSRSRGDHRPNSDIDLAIVCPNASDKNWLQIIDIVGNADTLLEIDCVRYDTLANLKLKDQIDLDKKVIYER